MVMDGMETLLQLIKFHLAFSTGYNAQETLCYDPSTSCFDVVCDGGTWQEEVSGFYPIKMAMN